VVPGSTPVVNRYGVNGTTAAPTLVKLDHAEYTYVGWTGTLRGRQEARTEATLRSLVCWEANFVQNIFFSDSFFVACTPLLCVLCVYLCRALSETSCYKVAPGGDTSACVNECLGKDSCTGVQIVRANNPARTLAAEVNAPFVQFVWNPDAFTQSGFNWDTVGLIDPW
jgi:hypothetical protein